MRYDHILFDLDGTVIASEEGIINCASRALETLGREVPPYEEMLKFIGPPLKYSFSTYCGLNDEDALKAVNIYRERYSKVGWKECTVYPGIPALFKALKKNGVRISITTGKPEDFAKRIIEHFGLGRFVDRIVGITMTDHKADKVELIKRSLTGNEKNPCMIGDRMFDTDSAHAMGIDSVGVTYGYGTEEELLSHGATYIASSADELASIFGLPAAERGMFISFEGSDGCGKTTQMKLLAEWLKTCGWNVKTTREPGGGPISESIRRLVLDPETRGMTDICEAYLFAAARAQHVRDTIRPALESGQIVLCDRFIDSSIAFQGAGRGLGTDTVMEINRIAVDGTLPDATMLFEIDPSVALARRLNASSPDRIEQEKSDFVKRVYSAFRDMAKDKRFVCIDANGTIDQIADRVKEKAFEILAR